MQEKFESRRLTGNVNVTCKFEDGTIRMWTQRKEDVVRGIQDIVNRYSRMGLVLTLRQLHYQMVSHNPKYVNHDSAYKKLGTILDDMRYSGEIDWDAIEDRGRVPYLPYSYKNPDDALADALRTYRIDRQDGQENIVEMWTEKDALSGILRRPTSKYHIQLVVNKGYSSSTAMYNAYQRIISAYNENKTFTILYFGDHDPSGLDMVRDIRERLEFMMSNGDELISEPSDWLIVKHIGLTMQQIRQYNLPPNPTKPTDARSADYVKKFGTTCWEVDALAPDVLIALVETFIEATIDMDKYEETVAREKADKVKLKSFLDNKDNLNDNDDNDEPEEE